MLIIDCRRITHGMVEVVCTLRQHRGVTSATTSAVVPISFSKKYREYIETSSVVKYLKILGVPANRWKSFTGSTIEILPVEKGTENRV